MHDAAVVILPQDCDHYVRVPSPFINCRRKIHALLATLVLFTGRQEVFKVLRPALKSPQLACFSWLYVHPEVPPSSTAWQSAGGAQSSKQAKEPSRVCQLSFEDGGFPGVVSRSVLSDSVTTWTVAHQASLSFTISRSLLKLTSIESMMPSNHLVLCHPLLLLPSIFPSIRVFSNQSVLCIRQPKYWSFSFSIGPSNEYSGLISFRIDRFDLLAVQGIKSLLQNNSLTASDLQPSAFFVVQLSHPYMTTRKTITLTRQIFVSKVMSLLFNVLSGFIIAFLPRSKHLLISFLQSLSTVILEPKKIKWGQGDIGQIIK